MARMKNDYENSDNNKYRFDSKTVVKEKDNTVCDTKSNFSEKDNKGTISVKDKCPLKISSEKELDKIQYEHMHTEHDEED